MKHALNAGLLKTLNGVFVSSTTDLHDAECQSEMVEMEPTLTFVPLWH